MYQPYKTSSRKHKTGSGLNFGTDHAEWSVSGHVEGLDSVICSPDPTMPKDFYPAMQKGPDPTVRKGLDPATQIVMDPAIWKGPNSAMWEGPDLAMRKGLDQRPCRKARIWP